MSPSIASRVALVTGSATGIGRATALRFAKRGLAVAVNYSRSEKEAQETLEEVKSHGVAAILCQCDVAVEAEVRAMIGRCHHELGGLDILVNNAGATRFIDHADLDALTDEVWDEILGVNLKGTFYCCRAALPLEAPFDRNPEQQRSMWSRSKLFVNRLDNLLQRLLDFEIRLKAYSLGHSKWPKD
jgi:NAD(P)-dependent dehydrogenase (short-subunit alcohol dehydrogenase family)